MIMDFFSFLKEHYSKNGKIKYRFFSQQRSGGILLEIPIASPISAQFVNEHSGHYFGKQYNFLRELQIGQEDFDSKVYIYSEQNSLKQLLINNSELREAISQCLDDKGELIIDKNFVRLKTFPQGNPEKNIYNSKEALFELIEQKHEILNKISQNWNFLGLELDPKRESYVFFRGHVLDLITWVYFLLSIYFVVHTSYLRDLMLSSESWVYSLLITGLISPLLFWISYKFLRASSWTFHYLIRIWIMQIFSTLLFSYSVIPFVNINYDISSPKTIESILIAKKLPQGKGRPWIIYDLHDDKIIRLEKYVDFDDLDSYEIGELKKYKIHLGYLGFKWGDFYPSSSKLESVKKTN